MENRNGWYVEHFVVREDGYNRFNIVDASTIAGPRPHDDVVWVGIGDGFGRWMSPDEAEDFAHRLAQAVDTVVTHHRARRAAAAKQV